MICDNDGQPVPLGSEAEQAAVIACLDALGARCDSDCQAIVAAGCSNGPPDVASCTAGCDIAIFSCPAQTAEYLECAEPSPNFICTTDGVPSPEGCESETQAVSDCVTG